MSHFDSGWCLLSTLKEIEMIEDYFAQLRVCKHQKKAIKLARDISRMNSFLGHCYHSHNAKPRICAHCEELVRNYSQNIESRLAWWHKELELKPYVRL